jgi:hypothetical protein
VAYVNSGESKECPRETLCAILKGTKLKQSPSVFIVADDEGRGPNAHFSVPIGGGESSLDVSSFKTPSKASASSLPEMLSIQLSSGDSHEEDTEAGADRVVAGAHPSPAPQQGTIVQLPPVNTSQDAIE